MESDPPAVAGPIHASSEATGGPPVDLDSISLHWRLALDAAQHALQTVSRCGRSVDFPTAELHQRTGELVRERELTARLLDQLAREEHRPLHRRLATAHTLPSMLGLHPDTVACVFDLDGVLTASAAIHAAAWAETFDELLARRTERTGERFAPFKPFDPVIDYARHIHGRPRLQGVHAFLASRGIRLREGHPDDPSGTETAHGLANRKNASLLLRLEREGVEAYRGSQHYLEEVCEAGLDCAVVSASANTNAILERAGLGDLIATRIDGQTMREERLQGKPSPDTLLAALHRIGVTPEKAAAFETTAEGVEAAAAAGFGMIVAVDREGRGDLLHELGADRVVADLADLLDPTLTSPR